MLSYILIFVLLLPQDNLSKPISKPTTINKNYFIPPRAFEYRDIIFNELNTYFPEIPTYNYIPSLIEHESCISLKSRRCWSPTSRLKTKREEGAGLLQITRAYRRDGSIRFDSLIGMKRRYKEALKDAKWKTIYRRPDVQIRMGILMVRDLYKKLYKVPNDMYRLHMVDAAYNGGYGGLRKERRACKLAKNCDSNIWFGHIEKYCLKSKKILYGRRSACDINRYHVYDVFNKKLPKYKALYFIGD
jgi:hypothetical protein